METVKSSPPGLKGQGLDCTRVQYHLIMFYAEASNTLMRAAHVVSDDAYGLLGRH